MNLNNNIVEELDSIQEKLKSLSFFNPFEEDDEGAAKEEVKIFDTGSTKLEKSKEAYSTPATEVLRVKNGYVVKATENFRKGDIIERAPVILQTDAILKFDIIKDIIFEIDKDENIYGLVLGNGSLYSHSDDPNMEYAWDETHSRMCFMAKRKISKGEVLTINYGFEYWEKRKPEYLKNNNPNIQPIEESDIIVDPNAIAPGTYNDISTVTQNKSSLDFKNPTSSGLPVYAQQ